MKTQEELVNENLKLAYWWGTKWSKRLYWMDTNDIMSAAQFGLLKAANSFDETKEIKFSSYASKCIQNEILLAVRNNKRLTHEVYSLDAPSTNNEYWGDEIASVGDTLEAPDNTEEWTTNHMLRTCIDQLDHKERILIYRHYIRDIKQEDLAKEMGHSQAHINRLLKRALEKMRNTVTK